MSGYHDPKWCGDEPVTPPADEVGRAISRITGALSRCESTADGDIVVAYGTDLSLILSYVSRVEGENAQVRSARDEAIKLMSEYARQAGDAKGRLEMSEAAGIVDGWREKCERLEGELEQWQSDNPPDFGERASLKLAVEALEKIADEAELQRLNPERFGPLGGIGGMAKEVLRSLLGSVSQSASPPLHLDTLPDAWQPVDTAPRCVASGDLDNGRRPVLVARRSDNSPYHPMAIGRLTSKGWISGKRGTKLWFEPTHWQHLPNGPGASGTLSRRTTEGRSELKDPLAPPSDVEASRQSGGEG